MKSDEDAAALEEIASPFASVLAARGDELPLAFQEQFLYSANAAYQVVLEGRMEEVWQKPQWLKPFFWMLSWFDMLFPETGYDIPAVMVISGRRGNQHPAHRWDRTFTFATPRRFNATMTIDPRTHQIIEQMGPGELLEMQWDIIFQPPNVIRITTIGCNLKVGRWRAKLPAFAYPLVCAVETARASTPPSIDIDLTVSHPWLGDIFGYRGNFTVRRHVIEE